MLSDRDFRYDLRPWLQPLLAPACAFAIGVGAGFTHPGVALYGAVAVGAAVLCGVLWRVRLRAIAWVCLLVAVCAVGGVRASWAERAMRNRPLARLVDGGAMQPGDGVVVEGWIDEPVRVQAASVRLGVRVVRVTHSVLGAIALDGRAVVRVRVRDQGASCVGAMPYGTAVRIDAVLDDDLAFRNPGVETLRQRLRATGIDLSAKANESGVQVQGALRGCPLLGAIYALRARWLDALDAGFKPRTAGVLRALLLGDGSRLDAETVESYRKSGAFHVIVVSGAHVVLIAGLFLWPTALATRSPAVRLLSAAIPVWVYCVMLGSQPPVARASLTLTLVLAAPLVARRAPPANTIGAVALLVLAWDPSALSDPSFQLTFAAVAAIAVLAVPALARVEDIGRWRPTRATPYPPVCSRWLRAVADALFWRQRAYARKQDRPGARFVLEKSRVGATLDRVRIQWLVRRLAGGLWVAAVVQAVLLPLSVAHFHRVTVAGVVASILIETLLGVALVAGFAWLIAHDLAPWCADDLSRILHWSIAASERVSDAFAVWGWTAPSGAGWRAALPWIGLLAFAGCAVAASRWRPVARTRRGFAAAIASQGWMAACGAVVCAAVCTSMIALPPDRPAPDGALHVLFLDVGQGDAAFIRFPNGETMLIDAGGRPNFDRPLAFDDGEPVFGPKFDVGERVVCETLWAMGVGRIDYVVASHGDVDHVGGLQAVFSRMSVGRAFVAASTAHDVRWLAWAEAAGVPVSELAPRDVLEIGGARIDVLWPRSGQLDANNRSLVLRLSFGERSFLFTGDIEARAEREVCAVDAALLDVDVLKVPHHGSRGSSTERLLAKASPRWAIVSAPRLSPYGHPHAEALARLRAANAEVLQTGLVGAIDIATDGRAIDIRLPSIGAQQ